MSEVCRFSIIQCSGNVQQEIVSLTLIGNETNNVFTICGDTTTVKAEFNATIDETNLIEAQKAGVKKI